MSCLIDAIYGSNKGPTFVNCNVMSCLINAIYGSNKGPTFVNCNVMCCLIDAIYGSNKGRLFLSLFQLNIQISRLMMNQIFHHFLQHPDFPTF